MMYSSNRRQRSGSTYRRSVQCILLGIICVFSLKDDFTLHGCQAFLFPNQVLVENVSVRLQRGNLRDVNIRTATILSLYRKRKEENGDDDRAPALPALGPAGSCSNSNSGDMASVESLTDAPVATTATVENETPTNTVQTFVNPKFALQYTCNVCETKNRVIVSRQAYREGMVIAVCKGCNNKHWIADNLDPTLSHSNIEEYFQSKGQGDAVNRVTEEVYEIERVWGLKEGELTDESGDAVLE